MVIVPEDLTLDMVSLDWAKAVPIRIVEIDIANNCFFMAGSGLVDFSRLWQKTKVYSILLLLCLWELIIYTRSIMYSIE